MDARDNDGNSALMKAYRDKDEEVIITLIENGATPLTEAEEKQITLNKKLINKVSNNDTEAVIGCLNQGANINAQDQYGEMPLKREM